MFKSLNNFLRNIGFRTKSYYDDCERIGKQRGIAAKYFEEIIRYSNILIEGDKLYDQKEVKKRLNEAIKNYEKESDKVDDLEYTLLGLPKLR